MTRTTYGMIAAWFYVCSKVGAEDGARQAIRLIEEMGSTFLLGGRPHPDPTRRINKEGDIMSLRFAHKALPSVHSTGVGLGFVQNRRSFGVMDDISWPDLTRVDRVACEFLRFAEILYPQLGPTYGWLDEVGSNEPEPHDALSLRISRICWVNFFGPPYVERYGRDFLLRAPGWRTEEMDDRGILYVLSPSFVDRWQVVKPAEVLQYFFQRIPDVRIYRAKADQFME